MEKLNELVNQIQELCETFTKESTSNVNGNKASGRRARKVSLELTKLFKEYRALSVEAEKE